jgi:hypothetical protein
MASLVLSEQAMNSASTVERVMTVWPLDFPLMVPSLICNTKPPIDFLVEQYPAQSESVNPSRPLLQAGNWSRNADVDLRYLRTHFAAVRSVAKGPELYLLRELTVKDMSGHDPSAAYMREPMRERYSVRSAGLS